MENKYFSIRLLFPGCITYFVLILLLLLFPAPGITVPPATVVVPPGIFTLPFLSAPPVDLGVIPPVTGLFFLLLPPLDFFLAAETTVRVPPISGEVCVDGSSSWFSTLGRFFSPRALARAMASATMRFAFSCLHRISTRRTEAGSPGALVMRMAWDGVVVVEGPAADVLMTFTTDTVPPAEDAALVCKRKMFCLVSVGVSPSVYCEQHPCTSGSVPVAAEAF